MLNEALLKGEDATQVEADEERWDELLATDEAQLLLEKMANEALAEHCAGQTNIVRWDCLPMIRCCGSGLGHMMSMSAY